MDVLFPCNYLTLHCVGVLFPDQSRPFVLLFSSISESFFMVKGAALFLQQGSNTQGPKTPAHHKHAGMNKSTQTSKALTSAQVICTTKVKTKLNTKQCLAANTQTSCVIPTFFKVSSVKRK